MADQLSQELILIYNADKGIINGLLDSVHKLISPNTYACDLCAITHDFAGPKKQWASFLKETTHPVFFYHKDDRPEQYASYELPIILLKTNAGIQTIMSKSEMLTYRDINVLIDKLRFKLNQK